jgi:hypothetical protein
VNVVGGLLGGGHEGTLHYLIPEVKLFQTDPSNFKLRHFLGYGTVK